MARAERAINFGARQLDAAKAMDNRLLGEYVRTLREHLVTVDRLVAEPRRATTFRSLSKNLAAEDLASLSEDHAEWGHTCTQMIPIYMGTILESSENNLNWELTWQITRVQNCMQGFD